jgi:hypothetical protein
LAENLDKGISYSEYLAENLDKGIAYSEYIAEKLDQGINYTEYLAENLNKGIAYSDYLAEKLNGNIAQTEAIHESAKTQVSPSLNENARETAESASKTELVESGFAGDYENLGSKIDSLIESVKTQKTEENINEANTKVQPTAQTQKADEAINEAEETVVESSGHKFIDEMPEDYAPIWESLNESQKQSIIAQSAFYNLETNYQIKNFWSTRQLGAKPVGLQKLQESQETPEPKTASNPQGYSNDYLNWVAKSLEGKF